jgi:snRNA-activating protein complex subunit 3
MMYGSLPCCFTCANWSQKLTRIDDGRLTAETPQAILTVTVHNKLSWRQTHVSRSSRHAILSSQTLGDLFEAIPCPSNEVTQEILDDGRVTGYHSEVPTHPGCVMCIEGLAYGDGESELDYAEYVHHLNAVFLVVMSCCSKLIQHLQTIPKDSADIRKAPTSMHDTVIASLSLRIGEPYWLLHCGNCEHFIVVDQIRYSAAIYLQHFE